MSSASLRNKSILLNLSKILIKPRSFEIEPEEANPPDWPGEMGRGVNVPEDRDVYDKYFKVHQFNLLASDRIALNRTIPDHRMERYLN